MGKRNFTGDVERPAIEAVLRAVNQWTDDTMDDVNVESLIWALAQNEDAATILFNEIARVRADMDRQIGQ